MIEARRISTSSATRIRLVPGLTCGPPCARGRSGRRRARGAAPPLGRERDRARGAHAELGGRRAPVEGDRAHAVGVDQHDELRRLGVGERAHPARPAARSRAPAASDDGDLERVADLRAGGLELFGRDVELAVAVAVDPEHLARDPPVVVLVRERHERGRERAPGRSRGRARRSGRRPRGTRPRAP